MLFVVVVPVFITVYTQIISFFEKEIMPKNRVCIFFYKSLLLYIIFFFHRKQDLELQWKMEEQCRIKEEKENMKHMVGIFS